MGEQDLPVSSEVLVLKTATLLRSRVTGRDRASAQLETGTSKMASTTLAVEPGAGEGRGDVGLGLRVAGDQLDREVRMLDTDLIDRHLRGHNRAAAAVFGVGAGHLGEDAEL